MYIKREREGVSKRYKVKLLETLLVCRTNPFECFHWYWACVIFSTAPHWLTRVSLAYYSPNPDMLNSIGLQMHYSLLLRDGFLTSLVEGRRAPKITATIKRHQPNRMVHWWGEMIGCENGWKSKREKIHTVVKKVKYGNLLAEAINARTILTHKHAHTNKWMNGTRARAIEPFIEKKVVRDKWTF